MDYLRAEEIIKELRGNRYPEETARKLDALAECCEAYDYDRLDTLVKELGGST